MHIRLNSYGGSCNAAVRMFDDIRKYPGSVNITVSGTAASAATVLCMAADRLEITPGSLFMIHDPSMFVYGNEKELTDAISLLRTCKDSILNIYESRVHIFRGDIADMMTATTWMDANTAVQHGFVDGITCDPVKHPANNEQDHAQSCVDAWLERKRKPQMPALKETTVIEKVEADTAKEETTKAETAEAEAAAQNEAVPEEPAEPKPDRVKVDHTDARLNDLKY